MSLKNNITFAQLQTLYDVSHKINSQLNLPGLLDEIMDLAVKLLSAEKGLILFQNKETGELEVQVVCDMDSQTLNDVIAMSRSTIDKVIKENEPVLLEKVPRRGEGASKSMLRFKITSVLCVPLRSKEDLIGVIYLDTTHRKRFFKPEDLSFLEAFSNLAGIAIENARSYQEIQKLNTNLEALVEERTQELQRKNQELIAAYEKLKAAQLQLIRSEKMASLGMLVAGIAHEINTPLGTISSNLHVFGKSLSQVEAVLPKINEQTDQRLSEKFQMIFHLVEINKQACTRISEILKNLKSFARLDEGEIKTVDIHDSIDNTLELIRYLYRDRIEIRREYGKLPLIQCYAGQINQVFMKILVNACQAIDGEGEIRIQTSQEDEYIQIRISDTGVGIPAKNLDKIFDPGFTTKGVGVGTGLGLSISYRIVEEHGGKIKVESQEGGGSAFTIILPINPQTKA